MFLIKPIKYFVIALVLSVILLMGYISLSVIGAFSEANIPLFSILKDDLTPEQNEKLDEILETKMSAIGSVVVDFLIPDANLSDFFKEADLKYEPTEWVPLTEQDILDSIKKGEQMQRDAFNKALDDAINFDNTTLKDARDKGIENAGGVD